MTRIPTPPHYCLSVTQSKKRQVFHVSRQESPSGRSDTPIAYKPPRNDSQPPIAGLSTINSRLHVVNSTDCRWETNTTPDSRTDRGTEVVSDPSWSRPLGHDGPWLITRPHDLFHPITLCLKPQHHVSYCSNYFV